METKQTLRVLANILRNSTDIWYWREVFRYSSDIRTWSKTLTVLDYMRVFGCRMRFHHKWSGEPYPHLVSGHEEPIMHCKHCGDEL